MSIKLHQRPVERERLKAEFLRGASVLMLAPRRIGKTWLLAKVEADLAAEGWLCIGIDLQGKDCESQFLRSLCQKIEGTFGLKERALAHLGQRFKQALGGIKDGNLADAVGSVDHREFLETLVKALNDEERPTLILVDELALFFLKLAEKDSEQAKSLLYHLRGLIIAYKNVRWFLTGSVGLDSVARRHGIEGAVLGLELFPLDPFTEAEAESFIAEMFERNPAMAQFSFASGAFDYLVQELGWLSPYHIEQVVRLIQPSGTPRTASIESIEAALVEILKPFRRTHFAPWAEHIDKNFEAIDGDLMKDILDILCDHPAGETALMTRLGERRGKAPSRRQLKDALIGLQADAYLVRDGEEWKFRSGLLRRYWREYYQQ